MKNDLLSNHLIARALSSARQEFEGLSERLGQYRLRSDRSQFEHVQEVALLVGESYPSSAAIAAAYLHDHEDYGRDWNYGRLEREFGNQVAMLIAWSCRRDRSLPPYLNHELYLTQVVAGPAEALAINCSEQISILRQLNKMIRSRRIVGPRLMRRWPGEIQYLSRLSAIFAPRLPQSLLGHYENALGEFKVLNHRARCDA